MSFSQLGTFQAKVTDMEQNSTRCPTSPPQGLLSPPPRLTVLTKSYEGSMRPHSLDSGESMGWGGHRSTDSVHTQERRAGVSAAQVLLGAEVRLDQQTLLVRRPALSGRSRWHGRPRVEARALPKLREWKWNGTDRSASVCLGGVDAALGAIHVLSRQLRGHLRGQAVGQGSGGRGHMLLKAVDARLFGGLGAG